MDESTRKACFDEISHQIYDADAKVSINDISSNWKVNLRESERLLWAWHDAHKQRAVTKEFLIRGVDRQGHLIISVIKESQLDAVERLLPKCSRSLFSLELPAAAANCDRLDTHQISDSVVINLPIEPRNRNGKVVAPIVVKPSTSSATASSSTFSTKPDPKVVAKVEPKVEQKPSTSSHHVAAVAEEKVKAEPETPTKSESKKVSPKKGNAKTPVKPAMGKSSIASFFSKPAAKTNKVVDSKPIVASASVTNTNGNEPMDTSDTESAAQTKKEASPPKITTKKEAAPKSAAAIVKNEKATQQASEKPKKSVDVNASRKRSLAALVDSDSDGGDENESPVPVTPTPISKRKRTATSSTGKRSKLADKIEPQTQSDDEIPGTPQENVGKPVVARKTSNKATRVRQIVDSSDEEGAAETKVPTQKETKPSKRKAKRMVTRTFEDEDGYIKTVKEMEEYTCSEDEVETVAVQKNGAGKSSTEKPSPTAEVKSTPTKKSPTSKAPKKPAPAATNSKQGSIMSFFKKK